VSRLHTLDRVCDILVKLQTTKREETMDILLFIIVSAIAITLIIRAVNKDAAKAEQAKEEQRAKWRKYSAAKRARRKASSGR
jgi:hypothetical protein